MAGPEGDALLKADLSHIWANEIDPQYAQDGHALLAKFANFLETGPEPAVLEAARCIIKTGRLSVIWSRLFMAAAVRGGALAELTVPYARRINFLIEPDTRKDAIDLVAAQYDRLGQQDQQVLEEAALDASFDDFNDPIGAKDAFLRRLFGADWARTPSDVRGPDDGRRRFAERRRQPPPVSGRRQHDAAKRLRLVG